MPKLNKKITIKDIARELDLSPATVSLVLNDKPHRLSPETRKAVLEKAKELNYRPNNTAVSLKTKKSHTIGMVLSDLTNAYFGELAKGADSCCVKNNYSLLLCSVNDQPRVTPQYLDSLIDKGVDGIIITSFKGNRPEDNNTLVSYIESYGIHVASIGYHMQYGNSINIYLDDKKGGYLATKHLIELGHKRIGCITGNLHDDVNGPASQRFLGYQAALKEADLPYYPEYMVEADYTIEDGLEGGRRLLSYGVTAIVTPNDLCAYGIYKYAQLHNIRIPDELSVVGYDDIIYSDFFTPGLTTIRQPACEMGRLAAEKLIKLCNDPELIHDNQDIIFKPELIVRESTRSLI